MSHSVCTYTQMAETKVSLNCAYLQGHVLIFLFYFISFKKHVWPPRWFLDLSWVVEMVFLKHLRICFPSLLLLHSKCPEG